MNKAAKIHQDNISHKHPIEVFQVETAYLEDPTQVFNALCVNDNALETQNSLLLESAEISSKENLKSLLLIDAAVRIECRGHQVVMTAKTLNGQNLLQAVKANLTSGVLIEETSCSLTLHFESLNDVLDEDSRLRQSSSFDALRVVQHSFDLEQLSCSSDINEKFAIFIGGLFAYDLVANFENLGDADTIDNCPDYVFYVAETLMVFDHQAKQCHVQASAFNSTNSINAKLQQRLASIAEHCTDVAPLPKATQVEDMAVQTNINDQDFCQIVRDLKEFVVKGDIFQVVPSRRFTLPCPSPLSAYKALKQSNPSPYMFYMKDELFTLFGASPESALKYDADSEQIEIYPIAGTRRRGKNTDGSINFDLDSRIELELRNDKKENAEHMMLVDLARNDVARIATAGSRHVADLLKVDRYSHVMHLVSRVVGELRHDLDALHAYQACMNMGTLTGAPKIRAMQLIREVEQQRRGTYGGAVGYLTGEGDLDTCIVIRSAYVENGIAHVQAGAGVVFDSDPQSEADETRGKAQACISAIQLAHQTTDANPTHTQQG
ncbi:anthranilate synthase component 1 [Vibrio rumoiensis]|uniref:Anthranilate synthase component 1 n=1 Tax=Vibrio rumoiensis 1S-45 TaxID=1188252 RepID=A0A1E5E4Q4_9VIBR|nr:anthranilate synthase component 1 [Vibrio rumoiensis]OEF27438.1 anthranilate synthase component I [Vibrio rumoiensis 1S-45]